ncbi:MAG: radical SAM family heme chaperone HemW [Saprospiraceae bacterium]|nr:radical SAM family heme chaperone HemW [Saprospiraceae bacterium]
MSGIYIHIPFCKQACHYCNFHFSTSLKYRKRMMEAIVKEVEINDFEVSKDCSSIYLGGGTPSILTADELSLIFEGLRNRYQWNEDIEITLEANPDDIFPERLEAWKTAGINRLSIGIQSFYEEDLQWMNRAHDSGQALKAIDLARDHGFDNLTIDLIYGSPTTSDEMWRSNIQRALDYNIKHISSYCLTVEEGTALEHFIRKGKSAPLDQEKAISQFDVLMDTLEEEGFEHYEISNFAKPGFHAVHNTSYWKGVPYIGYGPSAHSYNGKRRQWNIANNMKYIKAIESGQLPAEGEELSAIDRYNEHVLVRLRTIWGINPEELDEKYRIHFLEKTRELIDSGMLILKDGRFTLTRQGKHMADFVSMELMYG